MNKKFIILFFLIIFTFFGCRRTIFADIGDNSINEGRFGITGLKKFAQSEEILSMVKKAGIKWSRLTIAWDSIEPVKGVYDWSTLDKAVIPLLKK